MDAWDTKCLRGSAGAIFSFKVTKPFQWADLYSHLEDRKENSMIYLADNNYKRYPEDKIVTYDNVETGDHVYIVIGGETHGISQEAIQYV